MTPAAHQKNSQQVSYRLGVDIGGTFTDIVLVGPSGQIMTRKVSSTEDDYARGIVTGIRDILALSLIHISEPTRPERSS